MKRIIISLLVAASLTGFGQVVERISAKDAGLADSPNLYGFFNKGKDGIFHTEIKEKGKQRFYILERFNNDLSKAFSREIPFEAKEEVHLLEIRQSKILLFTTHYDGKDKSIFLTVMDYISGKNVGPRQKLGSLPSDPFGTGGRDFPVLFSPDETKMMIISSFQWAKKPQEVNAELYDLSSMKITSTFAIPSEYEGAMIKTRAYALTDEGNLVFIARTESKEKNAEVKQMLAFHEISKKSFKFIQLPFEKKKIENSHSFIKNGNYYYTGVFKDDYSKKDDKENKAGLFCTVADLKELKLISSDMNYFPADIEQKLTYKDGQKRKDLSEKEFTSKGIFKTTDGFYLVENLTYTSEATSGNTTIYRPYSRELIVTKFGNSGKIEFVKIIPKNTTNKMYGEDIIESNGNLFLFYCEHPKNLEKYTLENFDAKEYDDVRDLRGPVGVGVKVSSKGELSRDILITNETWCYWPGSGIVLKNGKEIAIMEIQKDEYILEVFRILK